MSATAGSDFKEFARARTLTFARGRWRKAVTVTFCRDTIPETDETFNLTLTSPTGGEAVGTGTIRDDDTGKWRARGRGCSAGRLTRMR